MITVFTYMFVITDFDTASTCESNILELEVVTGIRKHYTGAG
jgi:hypothetical protein